MKPTGNVERPSAVPPAPRSPCTPGSVKLVGALAAALALASLTSGCRSFHHPGTLLRRGGDEIVAAGQLFHTGTPVVLWTDPGGYDAYRVERRFSPLAESAWEASKAAVSALTTPNRYGLRREPLSPEEIEQVRGGGWDLATLQRVVDQFVLHYDACGTSRQCFRVLHDLRDLSVHFLLDLDGTVYQTLDLKERAWHATTSNTRSIGIEIAHVGAFPRDQTNRLAEWYAAEPGGRVRISVPERLGDPGFRTPGFIPRPARPQLVSGSLQGAELFQYDFTTAQYRALARLTAALCRVFPKLKCDYPRDAGGRLIPHQLSVAHLQGYQGLLGHFHVQTNKVDPGPAFRWDDVVTDARRWLARDPVRKR